MICGKARVVVVNVDRRRVSAVRRGNEPSIVGEWMLGDDEYGSTGEGAAIYGLSLLELGFYLKGIGKAVKH